MASDCMQEPTQDFVQSRDPEGYFWHPKHTFNPELAPILLSNPESRASNKGNPGSLKTYLRSSIVSLNRIFPKMLG